MLSLSMYVVRWTKIKGSGGQRNGRIYAWNFLFVSLAISCGHCSISPLPVYGSWLIFSHLHDIALLIFINDNLWMWQYRSHHTNKYVSAFAIACKICQAKIFGSRPIDQTTRRNKRMEPQRKKEEARTYKFQISQVRDPTKAPENFPINWWHPLCA